MQKGTTLRLQVHTINWGYKKDRETRNKQTWDAVLKSSLHASANNRDGEFVPITNGKRTNNKT